MHQPLPLDTETHRATIDEIDEDTLYVLLDELRERRLRAVRVLEEAEEIKRLARSERVREMVAKHVTMFDKELLTCTKNLDKLEQRVNKIKALRLEIGATW
jgi:hypothetical protein